jgi:hypothetical protein
VTSETYAVAVRDGADLLLFMEITRKEAGDFYSDLPRPHDPSIKAHSSYHASGEFHVRTHGLPQIMHDDRQRPDPNFAGSQYLMDQKITPAIVRSIGKACEPEEWSAVFELSVADLGDGNARNTHVTADLVAAGAEPSLVPNARVIRQERFRQSSPFLVLTLYEMPQS